MTAAVVTRGIRRGPATTHETVAVPPLRGGPLLARTVLVTVLLLSATLLLHLVVLSSLQQRSTQQRLFERFRGELATGTAPLGATDEEGRLLRVGTPVAFLEIPSIGVRQVVVEGTTSGALTKGPGHRRDSPLPGQVGVSVVLGRAAAFGGPFARLEDLERGDRITATTGQGSFAFRVLGVRHEGDPLPPSLTSDGGRLVLTTADGSPFFPHGVVRVDAELDDEAQPGTARPFSATTLPAAENTMAADTGQLWSLALWLELLIVLALGSVWAWHRWGHARTWIVFLPPLLLVSLYVANNTALLLPNLL